MNILVTNDDGFDAPGIRHLTEAVAGTGNIMRAAPDKNYSGASSSLTLTEKIAVRMESPGHYRIFGTPCDCVHLALTCDFLPARPDLIVSGINDGANMGDDTVYSGTVAAAMEGHLFGVPGFAFSMAGKSARNFAAGAAVARDFVLRFQRRRFSGKPLFNINIPDAPLPKNWEFAVTRLGRRHPAQKSVPRPGENGNLVYVIGEAGDAQDNAPDTDFYAVSGGRVSVTPLKIDLTDAPQISRVRRW
ncbi:MAG: 5'/3'-nucleotidase SurE, partial [Betaproteobacteria bacterium]|nr:5'/3'-nucleotidase SurE [Betaproteobacteria bacterium]